LDLLVRTPSEVAKRLNWGDFFLREILEKGKVMYEPLRVTGQKKRKTIQSGFPKFCAAARILSQMLPVFSASKSVEKYLKARLIEPPSPPENA